MKSEAKKARFSRESDRKCISDDSSDDLFNAYLESGDSEGTGRGLWVEWYRGVFLDNDQPGDDITADLAQMADKGLRSKTNEEKAKFLRINGPTMSPVHKRQKVQTSYGVSWNGNIGVRFKYAENIILSLPDCSTSDKTT